MAPAPDHMKALSENACSGCGAFETRDFYLACFLHCVRYELLDLRAEGTRRVFVDGAAVENRSGVACSVRSRPMGGDHGATGFCKQLVAIDFAQERAARKNEIIDLPRQFWKRDVA
jgi:hypothetical protein